jgi:hypothetical protein
MAETWKPPQSDFQPKAAPSWKPPSSDMPATGNASPVKESAQKPPEGFWNSVIASVNPIPAVKEWLERPAKRGVAMRGAILAMKLDREKRQPTPEEQAILDEAYGADVGTSEGNILREMATPVAEAGSQAESGDLAGAAGTLVGSYAVAPAIGAGVAKVAPVVGRGAKRAGTAVLDASQHPVVKSGAKAVPGLRSASYALDAVAEARDLARSRSAAPPAAADSTLVPAAVEAPPSRLQRLVRGDMPTEELFPAREIPPEAPTAAAPTEGRKISPTVKKTAPMSESKAPKVEPGDGSKMAAEYRRDNVQKTADPAYQNPRKTTAQPEVVEQPSKPVEKPEVSPVSVASVEDLRKGAQSILDRRKSKTPPADSVKPVNEPAPAVEQPAPAPKSEPVKAEAAAPAVEENPYLIRGREVKATAYADWLKKNATPGVVGLIKENKWSVVANMAGLEKPSAPTIQRILEKLAVDPATPATKKPPVVERAAPRSSSPEPGRHTVEINGKSYPVQTMNGRSYVLVDGKRVAVSDLKKAQ